MFKVVDTSMLQDRYKPLMKHFMLISNFFFFFLLFYKIISPYLNNKKAECRQFRQMLYLKTGPNKKICAFLVVIGSIKIIIIQQIQCFYVATHVYTQIKYHYFQQNGMRDLFIFEK